MDFEREHRRTAVAAGIAADMEHGAERLTTRVNGRPRTGYLRPTERQLATLRELEAELSVNAGTPGNRNAASQLIKQLSKRAARAADDAASSQAAPGRRGRQALTGSSG